jgi:hypothetical protein
MSGKRKPETDLRQRYILNDPNGNEVCLQDLIDKLIECTATGAEMEFSNTPHIHRNHMAKVMEFYRTFKTYKDRMGKVRDDMYLRRGKTPPSEIPQALIDNNKKLREQGRKNKLEKYKKELEKEGYNIKK